MKKLVIIGATVAILSIPRIVHAQGIVYLSNLDQPSAASLVVGSDSWYAAMFITGPNASGYLFDSLQLEMANAFGTPNGFTAMLYTDIGVTGPQLGSSLGSLSGSADPATIGPYTYIDTSSLILSPSTHYFIVLTAGTAVANDAYEWSHAGTYSYNQSSGWNTFANVLHSSDGSSWASISSIDPQFAITATPIPEPSPSWLLLLGSGILFYVRRAFHR